jgi:hypothetical protein
MEELLAHIYEHMQQWPLVWVGVLLLVVEVTSESEVK